MHGINRSVYSKHKITDSIMYICTYSKLSFPHLEGPGNFFHYDDEPDVIESITATVSE
jgi:hypothetical protein